MGKNTKRVLGLMSGTSMDGLDMCLAEISLSQTYSFSYNIINTNYEKFDTETISLIKKTILNNNNLNELNNYLGKKYLNIVEKYYSANDMDLISMHGQTIHHIDSIISIQAGSPKNLHKKFKVPIIYNFRYLDIEKGGTGAPLMPFLDWLLFKTYQTDVITLNIGGISNISYIQNNCNLNDVVGFDTGPGMSLIDEFVLLKWNKQYDSNGLLAVDGNVNPILLNQLLKNEYINKKPPKSTGREEFGIQMINSLANQYNNLKNIDLLRTLICFTAESIVYNLKYLKKISINDTTLIISGGGIYNKLLMEDIKKKTSFNKIITTEKIGINPDIKEAFLMCVLGFGRSVNLNTNVPSVTGASDFVSCGDIYG